MDVASRQLQPKKFFADAAQLAGMKPLPVWAAWLISAEVTALMTPTPSNKEPLCSNNTLPWTVPRKAFDDLSDSVFETLMRCPEGLHGCSDELVSCQQATYAATCSCEANCKAYRDCCWNVAVLEPSSDTEFPESACVEVEVESFKKFIYMVVGCPSSWPRDDVRESCEQAEYYNETFYVIPATSVNQVTYRNAFCALCNEDLDDSTFWNATRYDADTLSVRVILPDFVVNNPTLHLRPCSQDSPNDTCTKPVPKFISTRCKTYYAPVEDKESPGSPVFRNVYCAMCNGASLSTLSCSPTLHLSNFTLPSRKKPGIPLFPSVSGTPNLAALFKPVVSTPTCYAEHDGHCYIRHAPGIYSIEPRSGHEPAGNESSTSPPEETPERNSYYRAHNYVTIISLSLSICCLVLKVAVFCIYQDARSFSSKCTLCLSVTILVTHVLYLIANCFTVPPLVCLISAILLHYGFLSTFFWTSVLSYDIWRGVTAMKLYSTRRKTLALYGALAWGLPLAIVSAAFTVNWTTPDSELSPGYGRLGCWIGTFYGLITYFLVPMATLLLFCLCLYLRTICYIRNTALAAGSLREPAEDTSEDGLQRKQQRSHMSLFARLALIMGATWAIAFIGIFVPSVAFDIITNALVGCQGLYLFLAFKDYRYFCSCVQKRTSLTPLNGSPGTSHSDLASSKKSSRSKST